MIFGTLKISFFFAFFHLIWNLKLHFLDCFVINQVNLKRPGVWCLSGIKTCFRRNPDGIPNFKKCFVGISISYAAHLATARWALLHLRFIYICPFVAAPCTPAGMWLAPALVLGTAWLSSAFPLVSAVSPFMAPIVPLMWAVRHKGSRNSFKRQKVPALSVYGGAGPVMTMFKITQYNALF